MLIGGAFQDKDNSEHPDSEDRVQDGVNKRPTGRVMSIRRKLDGDQMRNGTSTGTFIGQMMTNTVKGDMRTVWTISATGEFEI